MPIQTVWIDPDLLLEHQGVRVFHTYKDDEYDQGAKRYWFTLNSLCGHLDQLCEEQPCRHVFDVRELSTWQTPEHPPYCIDEHDTPENRVAWEAYWDREELLIRQAIRVAIERRELTSAGRQDRQSAEIGSDSALAKSLPVATGEITPERSLDHG